MVRTRHKKLNKGKFVLFITTILLIFIFLPLSAFCIKSQEVVNEKFKTTYIDSRSCFIWMATLKNNASVKQTISLEIYGRDGKNNIIIKKDMKNIVVPRYSSREIDFTIFKEMTELEKIVEVSSFIYSASEVDSSDASVDQSRRYYDYQQENARIRNEKKERAREEKREEFRQNANAAALKHESLRTRYNLKVAVYRLCPSSYPSNSDCARLKREIAELNRELDNADREYKRNKNRFDRR